MPVVDGNTIPVAVVDVNAQLPAIPLIVGTNANEGTLFPRPELFGGTPVADDTEYQAALVRAFGAANAALVAAQYPSSSFASANDALIEVIGDAFFVCPARRFTRKAATAGASVYLYSFDHAPEQPLWQGLGAYHSAELAYVFGINPGISVTQTDEMPLVATVQGYWTRFAKNGDPNGSGAASWPTYVATADENLSIDLPDSKTETAHKQAKCDFWDSIY